MSGSFEHDVKDLEALLAKCRENPKLALMMAVELRDLQELLSRLREAKVLQSALGAAKRRATLDCNRLRDEARYLGSRIRWGIASVFGRRTPEVAEYGITPLRSFPDGSR